MILYRASPGPQATWQPLDATASTRRRGWRFNDPTTPIIYAAERESLAVLEVVARPSLHRVQQVIVAELRTPDGWQVAELEDLGLTLPSNWNNRPAADDQRMIAREFLDAIGAMPVDQRPFGLRVPSVLSRTDFNVLVDPSRAGEIQAQVVQRLPFKFMGSTDT